VEVGVEVTVLVAVAVMVEVLDWVAVGVADTVEVADALGVGTAVAVPVIVAGVGVDVGRGNAVGVGAKTIGVVLAAIPAAPGAVTPDCRAAWAFAKAGIKNTAAISNHKFDSNLRLSAFILVPIALNFVRGS
jgi:hypothetical protein